MFILYTLYVCMVMNVGGTCFFPESRKKMNNKYFVSPAHRLCFYVKALIGGPDPDPGYKK